MALPVRKQVIWWSASAVVLIVTLWILGDILLPFVAGTALAYLLDPLADRIERVGVSRFWATAVISATALLAIVSILLVALPLLISQLSQLVNELPAILAALQEILVVILSKYAPSVLENRTELLSTMGSAGNLVESIGSGVVSKIFSVGIGAVNMVMFVLIVPVVMIYMLADWDRLVERVDSWLPRDHAADVRALCRDVDLALAGFVRGQLMVCSIVAVFYSILLQVVGLNFGFAVGLIAGFLSFIPFVGAIGGGMLAVGLAAFQFWSEPVWILAVVAIFVAGQILEGNFLTPRLVGKSVGLHPVWLLFALSAFGALFGFVGMLVAVPTAAIIGVFARYGVGKYMKSPLYMGKSGSDEA